MSSAIWDATNQKEIPISGLVNINDSVVSEDSTFSSKKISDELVDKVDYKLVIENGNRYVEDIVVQEMNNWLPNNNSSIVVNLKKAKNSNSSYANFQLLCNKQDSKNWSCIVSGGEDTLWKIRYVNEVRYVDELATMDKVGITVKRYTASNYSSSTSNYVTLEATSKKRIILNAYYDYDANVAVSAYFVNNNQLRWKIVSGSVNEGHNVVIEYGEISN